MILEYQEQVRKMGPGSRVRDPGPGTGPGMRTCSEYQLYHIIEVPLRLKNFTY